LDTVFGSGSGFGSGFGAEMSTSIISNKGVYFGIGYAGRTSGVMNLVLLVFALGD
jgi:hypothetical protein